METEYLLLTDDGEYRKMSDDELVIRLKDMNSVPEVMYKGDNIEGKIEIDYHWTTKGHGLGKHSMYLKRFNKDSLCTEEVKVNRLGLGETEGEMKMKDKTILMDEEKRVELLLAYQRELGNMLINCNALSQNATNELSCKYAKVCAEIGRMLIPPHHGN